MPIFSKPVTMARASDLAVTSIQQLLSQETMDHLVRYLGTWSGSDKLLMIIQYILKLLIPMHNVWARLRFRAGMRVIPTSRLARGYGKLYELIVDARILWRFWGILPIIQWLNALERNPPTTTELLTIERLQAWSMLAYYVLEHAYYLCYHGILPSKVPSLKSLFSSVPSYTVLDPDAMGTWSCRFWALYVLLQFAHLREDWKLLKKRDKTVRKAKGTGSNALELEDLNQRWDAFWNEVVVNVGYLPLTLHWSLKRGLFSNEIWVGVFGLVAGLASFRSGWKAFALPPSPQAGGTDEGPTDKPPTSVPEESDIVLPVGYSVTDSVAL